MSQSNGTKAVVSHAAITSAVRALREAVTSWETGDSARIVHWRGVERRAVSQTIEQAAVALFELVDTLTIETASRALVLAIDAFDDAFTAWAEKCGVNQEQVDPAGTPDVWNAYKELLEAMTPRHFPKPEPIPALLSQKVSYRNIAKIYNWFDQAGNPDTTMVQEEITAPGTHYNAKTFKSRSQKRYEEEIERAWSQRSERLGKRRAYREAAAPTTKEPKPCPETIEDLLRSGVNVQQVAKMHRTTVGDVRRVADELGIPLSGNATASAFLTPDPHSEEEQEIRRKAEDMRIAGLNTHSELGDDPAGRMAAMAADGVPNSDIARALASAFPGMTRQHVTAALGKRKEKVTA